MYYLENDGRLENSSDVSSLNDNPVEVAIVKGKHYEEVSVSQNIIEPHRNSCKCMRCFVYHKFKKHKKTCSNTLYLILFLIFMYLVYMMILKYIM
jgi:hypothetical protein